MATEKAYKLLAAQEDISNKKAKDLIDKGLVSANNQRITVARKLVSEALIFKIKKLDEIKVVFEDDDILAINKPAFLDSNEIAKKFKNSIMLNRLDKETSGIMLFAKNEEFRQKAINEYRKENVYKEYTAVVDGKFTEEMVVDKAILTIKGKTATSKIDEKIGKRAKTTIYPDQIEGNKSKVKIVIENGRTHQIRVHCQYIGFPIVGDTQYGKKVKQINRMLLHSKKTKIFGYEFNAKEPREFYTLGFQP